MNGCYEISCWCAPFRWISSCCSKDEVKPTMPVIHTPQYLINQAAMAALTSTPSLTSQIPGHHRERTWKLSNGRMSYDQK